MVSRAGAIGIALLGVALPFAAHAGGLAPLQSDSACAAFVPGWQPNDYVRSCARLITQLKDTLVRCEATKTGAPAKLETDPQQLCANPGQTRNQLAAAYNDRAYFFILSRGTDNYRLAIGDLNAAIAMLDNYWLAIRNRAVAHMLLGDFGEARADFTRVAQAVSEHGPGAEAGSTLVKAIGEAEVRLGLGYANLGLCDVRQAQEQLMDSERLAMAPVGADMWMRAASLFGQGLALKVKGAEQARIAATNTAVTAAERGRLERYGHELTEQGAARMAAAQALIPSIREDIVDRFRIEELTTIANCRHNRIGS